jgi:hypothetical protein
VLIGFPSWGFLETQLVKEFPTFKETAGSFPLSQQPTTELRPEPDESSAYS